MTLETKRLLLRPWEEGDAPALYRYASDPRVGPAAGWPVHTSAENSREIIRDVLSAPETYAVVLKETGEPVGSVGLLFRRSDGVALDPGEAEIGYWIGVPYWGQGLIPEAVRELQRHCFEELKCTGLWCGYFDGNEKSRRAQEKCGFVHRCTVEGVPIFTGEVKTEHFTFLSREHWEVFRGREELIAEFHRMWDAFPGLARLIDREHHILAANRRAVEKGFLPGTLCCQVKTRENHRDCKLEQVLSAGEAVVDCPSPGKARGWLPVGGHPEIAVHFTLVMPQE